MKIGLFIPCYVDQLYPQAAIATLELLEKLGCAVAYPTGQTCCGQPLSNAGFNKFTGTCNENFIKNFAAFDYIVSPSGSCALHIKEHLHAPGLEAEASAIRSKVYELTEFITDILKVSTISAQFPHKVGLHMGCHGQRMLHLSAASENVTPYFSKAEQLLKDVHGLQLYKTGRIDECCGFGGTFCVTEEAVSVKMGEDRVAEHALNNVAYITSGDMSCLMHLEGILKRRKMNIKVIHLSQILNSK